MHLIQVPFQILSTINNEFTESLSSSYNRTTSIESCYQNVGIATSVALTMFQGDDLGEAMGVPLFYGIVEAILLGVYCVMSWKLDWTKAPATDPFFQVISMSYEIFAAEEEHGKNDSKNHEFHIESSKQNEGSDCQYVHHLEENDDSKRKEDSTRIISNSTENTKSDNQKRRRTLSRLFRKDKRGEALIEAVELKGGTMA